MGNVIYLNKASYKDILYDLVNDIISNDKKISIDSDCIKLISGEIFSQYENSYLKDDIKNIYSKEFKDDLNRYVYFIFSIEFMQFDELLLTSYERNIKNILNKYHKENKKFKKI